MAKVTVLNAAEFSDQVKAGKGLTLVDFYADWCCSCKMIAAVLDNLAEACDGKVNIIKIDADANLEVLNQYGVRGLPTLMMFKDGEPVGTRVGAQPASTLQGFIGEHL